MEVTRMTMPAVYVGIDVAKVHLDIAVRPSHEQWRVANTDAGIAGLTERLRALQPTLVVLEATGGYERAVTAALAIAGMAVAVVNPRQVRDFAKATGKLAKTDALDADCWLILRRQCVQNRAPCQMKRHTRWMRC